MKCEREISHPKVEIYEVCDVCGGEALQDELLTHFDFILLPEIAVHRGCIQRLQASIRNAYGLIPK